MLGSRRSRRMTGLGGPCPPGRLPHLSVSQNEQKQLGEFMHPIGSTRLMQIMQPSSSGADGIMYINAPTCDILTVPRWYASVMSKFDTRTRPWTRSASQNACRMRGKTLPNCSNSGAASLLVVSLTLGVSESECDYRLIIRRRRRCA